VFVENGLQEPRDLCQVGLLGGERRKERLLLLIEMWFQRVRLA